MKSGKGNARWGGGGTEVIVERRQGEECKKIEELSGEILLREKKKIGRGGQVKKERE